MASKFRRRVQIEREVLSLINAEVAAPSSLNGLAPRAAEDWAARVDWLACSLDRQLVVSLLADLGRCIQALSDQSRAAFDPGAFDEEEYSRLISVLKEHIRMARSGKATSGRVPPN